MTAVSTRSVSAEELLAMGDIGRCELVQGEIIRMAPAGAEHGGIALEVAYRVKLHVDAKGLGKVYAAETGFIISRNPDTVRAPDVAFVGKSRVPAQPRRGFFEGPPDLAVEVVSPDDRLTEVRAKVDQWLGAGTVSVWVVDPPSRTIEVYRAANEVRLYRVNDEIHDEPTLPGFALKVHEIFETDRP